MRLIVNKWEGTINLERHKLPVMYGYYCTRQLNIGKCMLDLMELSKLYHMSRLSI
jgi:hypothetical protein